MPQPNSKAHAWWIASISAAIRDRKYGNPVDTFTLQYLSGEGDPFNQFGYNLIGRHSICRGLIGQDESVSEAIGGDCSYIIRRDMMVTLKPGVSSRAAVESKSTTRTGTDLNPFFQVWGEISRPTCCAIRPTSLKNGMRL